MLLKEEIVEVTEAMFFATWGWAEKLLAMREIDIDREKTKMSNEEKDGHDIKHSPPQPRILWARIPWPGYKFLIYVF